MDGLEHTLEQLRAHDARLWPVRLRAVARRLTDVADAADQDGRRRAAAHLAVDALAVLAGAGGLASDVRVLAGEGGHVHEWRNRYTSCACGAPPPGDAADRAALRTARASAGVYCAAHDLDGPCTYEHPAPAGAPARYLPGAAGDREAWVDAEYAEDD